MTKSLNKHERLPKGKSTQGRPHDVTCSSWLGKNKKWWNTQEEWKAGQQRQALLPVVPTTAWLVLLVVAMIVESSNVSCVNKPKTAARCPFPRRHNPIKNVQVVMECTHLTDTAKNNGKIDPINLSKRRQIGQLRNFVLKYWIVYSMKLYISPMNLSSQKETYRLNHSWKHDTQVSERPTSTIRSLSPVDLYHRFLLHLPHLAVSGCICPFLSSSPRANSTRKVKCFRSNTMRLSISSASLLLVTLLAINTFTAKAYKDDSYYMPGKANPNVYEKMYWKDADNVLQDLSQFKALYVQYSHCAWTWMQMEEADNDVDENGTIS